MNQQISNFKRVRNVSKVLILVILSIIMLLLTNLPVDAKPQQLRTSPMLLSAKVVVGPDTVGNNCQLTTPTTPQVVNHKITASGNLKCKTTTFVSQFSSQVGWSDSFYHLLGQSPIYSFTAQAGVTYVATATSSTCTGQFFSNVQTTDAVETANEYNWNESAIVNLTC